MENSLRVRVMGEHNTSLLLYIALAVRTAFSPYRRTTFQELWVFFEALLNAVLYFCKGAAAFCCCGEVVL